MLVSDTISEGLGIMHAGRQTDIEVGIGFRVTMTWLSSKQALEVGDSKLIMWAMMKMGLKPGGGGWVKRSTSWVRRARCMPERGLGLESEVCEEWGMTMKLLEFPNHMHLTDQEADEHDRPIIELIIVGESDLSGCIQWGVWLTCNAGG